MREEAPKIDLNAIKQICTPRSFKRGEDYYTSGAIIEPVREGNTLRASCLGTAPEPYKVKVTIRDGEVTSASCTCPYDRGGACKHVIALLLTYIHEPEAFEVIDKEREAEALMQLEKEQLVTLIQHMVAREPTLRKFLVEWLTQVAGASEEPSESMHRKRAINFNAEVKRYQANADKAFRNYSKYGFVDYGSSYPLSRELLKLIQLAEYMTARGEYVRAIAILTGTFESIDENIEMCDDSDGSISSVASECIEEMRNIVSDLNWDTQIRHEWQEHMFRRFAKNRYGLADEVDELLLASCREEDVEYLKQLVNEELEQLKGAGAPCDFTKQYRWKSMAGFLSALYEHAGDSSKALEILREYGLHFDYAKRLLELGRIDDAVAHAMKMLDGIESQQFAELLTEAGAWDSALQVVERALGKTDESTWIWEDLMKQFAMLKERTRDFESARDAWMKLYSLRPTASCLEELQRIAQHTRDWERLRQWALDEAEGKVDELTDLIPIYLHLAEWEKAIEVARELAKRGARGDLVADVADAIADEHPEVAIELYQLAAEKFIEQTNRSAYRDAAKLLSKAKAIAQAVNPEAFQQYMDELRKHYKRRPALLEELSGI